MAALPKSRSGALLVLFFLSGASALIYQVVWIRMLGLVFGVTTFAVATVLGSFMAGLAFGNYFFGKRADRSASPLRLYALLELGIGLFGLCFPAVIAIVKLAYLAFAAHFHAGFAALTLVRLALSFAALFVPTMLMGGTLPVISKHIVKQRSSMGGEIGRLYSANNLGAVAGCLAAGFLLIAPLGVAATLYAAAGINLLVALTAWMLGRPVQAPSPVTAAVVPGEQEAREEIASPFPRGLAQLILWLFAVEGFVALAYEVVWIRILSASVLVNSVYSFSVVTASFILGLSLGSFVISRFIDKRRDLVGLFAGIEIAIGFSSVLLLVLFSKLPAVRQFGESSLLSGFWARNVAAEFGLSFLAMLVPATLMGMLFPLVTKLYTVNVAAVGKRIGIVGALNTVGSIVGALAGGFVLIALLGMYRGILVLAIVNVALGVVPICVNPLIGRKPRIGIAVVLCGVFASLLAAVPHTAVFWRTMSASGGGDRLLSYEEDYAATVSVVEGQSPDGRVKCLDVDGIPVAGTDQMLRTTQKIQAHIPLLLYESTNGRRAGSVLIVGLGSGGTSWSALQHDGSSITCVELVPGVIRAAAGGFVDVNHRVFDSPRYSLKLGDGRNFLLATTERYDVILTESVHPIYAGNASLYTKDYFESCRRKLTDRGILSVWLPIYRLSQEDFRTVLATFQSVFPHCTVWFTSNSLSRQVLVIGTMQAAVIDVAAWGRGVADAKVGSDLGELGLDDAYKLLDFFLMSESRIREFAGTAPFHTDNRPRLEFSAPKSTSDFATWKANLASVAGCKTGIPPCLVNHGNDSEHVKQVLSQYAEADRHVLAGIVSHFDEPETAIREYCLARSVNPLDKTVAYLLSDVRSRFWGPLLAEARGYQRDKEFARAHEIYARIIAADSGNAQVMLELARCCGNEGMPDSAAALLRRLLSVNPAWAEGYNVLGVICVRNRRFDEALQAFDKAIALDPRLAEAYSTRAIAKSAKGLFQEALNDLNRAVALSPENPTGYENRAFVYDKMGDREGAARDAERGRALRTRGAP